jgi:hypothetical protein
LEEAVVQCGWTMSPALVQNQDFSTVVFEAGVTVIASITLKMQESFAAVSMNK